MLVNQSFIVVCNRTDRLTKAPGFGVMRSRRRVARPVMAMYQAVVVVVEARGRICHCELHRLFALPLSTHETADVSALLRNRSLNAVKAFTRAHVKLETV